MKVPVMMLLLLFSGIAAAQSVMGNVGIEVVRHAAPPALPPEGGVITGAVINSTGEVTSPPPVIGSKPQVEIAVPQVILQKAERKDPAVEAIKLIWNFFFGFLVRF